MSNFHEMQLSDMDFGDNLKMIVCHQCGRSMSIQADGNGVLIWNTLETINQGDSDVRHQFFTFGDLSFSMSMQSSPEH